MTSRFACLLASLALTACTLPGAPTGQATPKPKVSVESKPVPSAATPLKLLQKPTGNSTVLAGTLRIDAAYAYNSGAGKLISNDGGGLITNDGGSLIGNDGAGLIGNDGAGILIAGGSLIGNDGGSLISNDGGGIVAQGGGNLISKRKYQLDASAASVRMAVGTLLRAANMEIQVIDMSTNMPISLGEDGDKHQVLSIVTNAGGGFKLYLPEKLDSRNVRIAVSALGSGDDRLTYQTLAPFKANESQPLDEDSALLARYVRGAFAARIERVFADAQKKGSFVTLLGPDTPAALKVLIETIGAKVDQASKDAHAELLTPAQRRKVAEASADGILGTMDLEEVTLPGGKLKMLSELRDVLHGFRDATAAKMRKLPAPDAGQGYLADQAWLVEANRAQAPADRYVLQTPTDLGEFVLRYILTNPSRIQQKTLSDVFVSVDYDAANYLRITAAMEGLLQAIFAALIPPDDTQDSPAMTRLLGAIKAGPQP
ncbi:MAG: hypothetical protein JWM80_6214 [Cyanobacteria bacterium RYN_339]|nr:hypothetical protein [Cyanobacteria bacterium RYN_339]